jgi:phytoene desaturase
MRAVVVGSGFGGLAAAIRLAAAGHEVTLLEKRDQIGGRAYQYEIDGFRFDGGPTVLTAPFMFEELFALAGERLADHVSLVPLDPFYRSFDADGRSFDHHSDADALFGEVVGRSPGDADGFRRLQSRISGIFDAFYPYTERPMMQPQVMLAMLPYLLQHRAMLGVSRMVDSFIRDPFLRQALSFHPLLIGGDPARTPALYALIVEFERRWGVHYAMGGTGALVAQLGGLLERLGGQIVTGAEVERIESSAGRVTGVRLADSTVLACDVVVSNADPGHTYGKLLASTPGARTSRARLRHARPSMSLHVLYLGADRTWPDTPLAHHSMLFARDQRAAIREVFPRRGASRNRGRRTGPLRADDLFLYVHMPTRTDPSLAPPGCESLYVLVATAARAEPVVDPAAEQQEVRSAVLDVLDSSYLPGLLDHIVVEHAIGPEHFRSVLNTPHGSAFSLEPTLFQSGWFRPHNRSRAVRGLYLVGAGTHPGAGVPAVLASARIAADLIAGDLPAPADRQVARS